VCGNICSVQEFIKTLRSKHVPLQPIVLLFPSDPPPVLWQQLSRFPQVQGLGVGGWESRNTIGQTLATRAQQPPSGPKALQASSVWGLQF
jgi:hypothetical protein